MKAPSFRCTDAPDGALILHYYSDRPGLESIVIGIVNVSFSCRSLLCFLPSLFLLTGPLFARRRFCTRQAVAKKLHKVDVDVKLLHSSQDSEHGQFLIQEKNKAKHQEDTTADDVDVILSNGDTNGFISSGLDGTDVSRFATQSPKYRRNSFVALSPSTSCSTATCPSSKSAIPSRGFCRPVLVPTAKSPTSSEW